MDIHAQAHCSLPTVGGGGTCLKGDIHAEVRHLTTLQGAQTSPSSQEGHQGPPQSTSASPKSVMLLIQGSVGPTSITGDTCTEVLHVPKQGSLLFPAVPMCLSKHCPQVLLTSAQGCLLSASQSGAPAHTIGDGKDCELQLASYN